jgi:hypothetical protein
MELVTWERGKSAAHMDVTVAIPSIPTRRFDMLPQALGSVLRQTHPIAGISIAVDTHREGAARTRQRALDAVTTPWVAFLDDDDELYPEHVERLLAAAIIQKADYTFSYWDTTRTANYFGEPPRLHGPDEHYGHYGHEFDPADPTHTTMTILVRTELAQSVGFTPRPAGDIAGGEDWRFTLGCVDAGAKIVHVPEQTWYWRHHGEGRRGVPGNTSGREDRW